MSKPRELTDRELSLLVNDIAKTSFKFFMRRVQNRILNNPVEQDMSINSFISALIGAMAVVDANLLRWIEQFYKDQVGKNIEPDKLRSLFLKDLFAQLDITLQ